jgi:Type III secretion basal body protein I, YscI, HrpB, PscI
MEFAQQIAFVPQTATAQAAGQATGPSSAARPDSIARFQTLMFAPEGAATSAAMPSGAADTSGASVRVQGWAEGMSSQWKGFDEAMQKMAATKDLSPKELLSLQYQLMKTSVSLELTSKSAGMVERNVQTLTQRS